MSYYTHKKWTGRSRMSKCIICKKPAHATYEGQPTCGQFPCEYAIQEAIDQLADIGSK